jgi:hypothetical protein
VYIPGIGRFLGVDPVEGGTENSYVYPVDAVNEFDLSGNLAQRGTSGSRGSALSGTDQWILDRYKGGLKLTKQELKRAKQLIRTTVKSDLKFKKIRPSRQTKDLIKKAGKYSKGFIFIFIPKPITDGLQPKSTGPSA